MVVCFEIEENLEKKSNSLGLARCIIYVRYVNGSKIKICQLVNRYKTGKKISLQDRAGRLRPVPSIDRCAESRRASIKNLQIQDSRYSKFKNLISQQYQFLSNIKFIEFRKFRKTRFLFLARDRDA